jgi:hypothetical protein
MVKRDEQRRWREMGSHGGVSEECNGRRKRMME